MPGRRMAEKEDRQQKRRRMFTPEYREEVVRLVQEGERSSFAVARELGLSPSVVRKWVKQAEIDQKGGGAGPLTTAERDELSRLRREVKTLRTEREILKKATAFFAKEGTS
jgi:transposase